MISTISLAIDMLVHKFETSSTGYARRNLFTKYP